jgi:hypothetical protein
LAPFVLAEVRNLLITGGIRHDHGATTATKMTHQQCG